MQALKMVVLLSLTALSLVGCSVKYKAVGSFDDFNEVFVGDVDHNLLAGSAYIVAETKKALRRFHTTESREAEAGCGTLA